MIQVQTRRMTRKAAGSRHNKRHYCVPTRPSDMATHYVIPASYSWLQPNHAARFSKIEDCFPLLRRHDAV